MATKRRSITPLIEFQSEEFARQYERGVWRSMYGDEQGKGPLSVSYLVENLKACAARGHLGEQDSSYHHHLGFYLGTYHGGVLSPQTGRIDPRVTALIAFDKPDAIRGYAVGREWFFYHAEPQERRFTETTVLRRVLESVQEMFEANDADETWLYTLGSTLGELSGHLFPMTEQDRQTWAEIQHQHEESYHQWQTSMAQDTHALQQHAMFQEA
jgi:hypothetical protein